MDGYIAKPYSIGYVNIPKNGSTSTFRYLYELLNGCSYNRENHSGKNIHRWARARRSNIDHCKYRIIILRDPIQRFLSMFTNKVHDRKLLTRETLENHLDSATWEKNRLQDHPDIHQFILNFNEYNKIPLINHHAKSQHEFLNGNTLDYFSHIFFVEELESLFCFIESITGKELTHPHAQVSKKEKILPLLTPQEIDWIRALYAKDFDLIAHAKSRKLSQHLATGTL
jgi:hypothetical protein